MYRECAPVGGLSVSEGQRHGTAPDRDGALVAEELTRAQPRAVLVRADASLDLLPLEGIEFVANGSSSRQPPNATERSLEVAPPQAAGVDSRIQRLSHGERRTEMCGKWARRSHRATIAGLHGRCCGFPQVVRVPCFRSRLPPSGVGLDASGRSCGFPQVARVSCFRSQLLPWSGLRDGVKCDRNVRGRRQLRPEAGSATGTCGGVGRTASTATGTRKPEAGSRNPEPGTRKPEPGSATGTRKRATPRAGAAGPCRRRPR